MTTTTEATSTALAFDIAFHGPFHILSGNAGEGSDLTVDPNNPLPAASLKGAMRAVAANLPNLDQGLVRQVFGMPGNPSIWSWSDAVLEWTPPSDTGVSPSTGCLIRQRSRIAVDDESGTVAEGALLRFDEVWAESGSFTIDLFAAADSQRIVSESRVLRVAASLVRSIGAHRNRGFGWVTMTPQGSDDHSQMTRELLSSGAVR